MPSHSRSRGVPMPGYSCCANTLLRAPEHPGSVVGGDGCPTRGTTSSVNDEAEELGCGDSLWSAPGRVVEEFVMEQPVPPYLFAFAIGEIGNREVGPRTRVYAEAAPELFDVAAKEFAGTEVMMRQGEKLFGEYEWERFDLLVLPPSFPVGGMENPRMVFLTPTVIRGMPMEPRWWLMSLLIVGQGI